MRKTWTRRQRFDALLAGESADRPIVSCWHHFLTDEYSTARLLKATIKEEEKYDWDWIKVNPRVIHLAEVWNNKYDYEDYRGLYPCQTEQTIMTDSDLKKVKRKSVKESLILKEHVELAYELKNKFPSIPIVATVFSPLSILFLLAGRAPYVHQTIYGSLNNINIKQMLIDNKGDAIAALSEITFTLKDYIKKLIKVGIDGIFYAVTGTRNGNFIPHSFFNVFSAPFDKDILESSSQVKRILHTCKDYSDPCYFDREYSLDGISWDHFQQHNPSIEEPIHHTPIGGIDHKTVSSLALDELQTELHQVITIFKMNKRPFMLSPECVIPENTTSDRLKMIRRSVEYF